MDSVVKWRQLMVTNLHSQRDKGRDCHPCLLVNENNHGRSIVHSQRDVIQLSSSEMTGCMGVVYIIYIYI